MLGRLNLSEGCFYTPLATQSPAVNACAVAPGHGLFAAAGEEGLLECFDLRQRRSVGVLDAAAAAGAVRASRRPLHHPQHMPARCAAGRPLHLSVQSSSQSSAAAPAAQRNDAKQGPQWKRSVSCAGLGHILLFQSAGAECAGMACLQAGEGLTALRFSKSGLQCAVGTQNGLVALYDLRSSRPSIVKDHNYGAPIKDIKFHASAGMAGGHMHGHRARAVPSSVIGCRPSHEVQGYCSNGAYFSFIMHVGEPSVQLMRH